MMGRNVAYVGALIVALLAAASAQAATVTLYDSYGDTNGGEFRAVSSGFPMDPMAFDASAGEFRTFCIEITEYIAFGTTYYADISTAAIGGGAGGGSPDPLDPLTAYLYARFASGQLASYSYGLGDGGSSRAASADALQHVIWYIEGEEGKTWSDGDGSLRAQFYQDALASAGSDIGNVRVVNLYADAARTIRAQDQLVLLPEPSTLILVFLGGLRLLGNRGRR